MALPNAQTIKEIIKGDTKKLVQEAERMGRTFQKPQSKKKGTDYVSDQKCFRVREENGNEGVWFCRAAEYCKQTDRQTELDKLLEDDKNI